MNRLTQAQVLAEILAGKSPGEIARESGATRQAVHVHLTKLRQKGKLPRPGDRPRITRFTANIKETIHDGLSAEADRRKCTRSHLITLILTKVVEDNLFTALELED